MYTQIPNTMYLYTSIPPGICVHIFTGDTIRLLVKNIRNCTRIFFASVGHETQLYGVKHTMHETRISVTNGDVIRDVIKPCIFFIVRSPYHWTFTSSRTCYRFNKLRQRGKSLYEYGIIYPLLTR